MCARPSRDRRDLDGRRRDAWAAVAHAHSAVSAHTYRDDASTHDGIADLAFDLARTPDHKEEIGSVCTATRHANPKRLRTDLAAAAACRLCPDWSDNGPPFR